MLRTKTTVLGLFCLFCLFGLPLALAGCGEDSPSGPDPYDTTTPDLCIMLEDGDPETLLALARDYGFEIVSTYGSGRFAFVEGEVDRLRLADDDRVLAFQEDDATRITSPVELTMSFFEGDFEDTLPTQDALAAWQLDVVHTLGTGSGVKVAVLDTGVDPTHPVLADRVRLIDEGEWSLGSLEVEQNVDSDGNGVVDEAFGHGTHVTGTIATIAPDAEILAIRVLDSDGVGTAFDLARGLARAQQWGADIVNLSLVLDGESDVVDEILGDLASDDVLIVGAAGNRPGEPSFPASESEVLSIAAHDALRALADFSAYDGVRLAAPGVEVLGAYPGERWASASGTSMAAASASGAAAVLTGILGRTNDARGVLRDHALELEPIDDGAIDLLTAAADAHEQLLR